MRPGVTIALSAVDRRRLEAIVGNRNASQKHAWRAEIVLLSAGGLGTVEIMRRTGKSKTCVWHWQERFAEDGVDGLLRDKTRPSRVAPLGQEVIDRVVALTATEPPHEATHWTGAAMAEAAGISVSSVQRIWKAHGLAPHRVRRFKLSNDPEFVPKLKDIVGLYVDPAGPCRGAVGRPEVADPGARPHPARSKGRAGTMTHDYKRHGTTTLFAALNVLDGSVLGRCMQRDRHQETRCGWGRRRSSPIAGRGKVHAHGPSTQRTQSTYLFGAVRPERGTGSW